MVEETVLKTAFAFERGGAAESILEGRAPVKQAGLSEMAENPAAWTPPHMYVASVESCFVLTMLAVAGKMRIGIKSCRTSAEARLVSPDGRHKEISEILIRVRLDLEEEGDRPKLSRLFQKAEEHCLVARSVRTRVTIESLHG